MSENVEWTEAAGFAYAGTYVGPQAVLEGVIMRLGTEWDGFAATPDQFIGDGDAVAAIGWYTGTYLASGKPVHARFVHLWTVTEGKAGRFEQIVDSAVTAAAMSTS